jgi:hypothetical protein
MNSQPNFDPTINYIARLAALTLRTLKSTIRDQNWMQSTQKSMKIDVGDLECCNVACQVLPHLILLIPTLEEWEQTRIAGKGDKIQIHLFVRVFVTKRT